MIMETKANISASYSKYWRINRSRNEAAELALALRAMRKVIGHLGRNVKPVFWKGMAENENRFIILDPERVKGNYPISHDVYDILVGQVVREGFLAMEFHEWVKEKTLKSAHGINDRTKPYLENLVTASENIFISELAKDRIWALYLSRYFYQAFSEEKRDPALPPTAESVFAVWQKQSIIKEVPESPHPYYAEILTILEKYLHRIRSVANRRSISTRREERKNLYRQMWQDIEHVISHWETFTLNPDAVNLYDETGPKGRVDLEENGAGEDVPDDPGETEAAEGLRPDLAEDVSAMLDEENPPIQGMAVAVEEPGARPMETRIEKGEVLSDIQPDAVQVRQMKKIFKKQEHLIRQVRRRRIRHGLGEGKLDPLRLYRVPLDGKVFKNRQGPGKDAFWQICIIADASASMSGKDEPTAGKKRLRRPWEIAEKSFVSLAVAAKGHGNLLDIYAYRAERQVCTLTRLYHDKKLYSVTPSGRTPSGQAIMAVANLLDKKFKNSMIIHITDGAANCGLSLGIALDYCRKHGIDVFTLGCGCNRQTRDFLREFFPRGHLYFLKSIHHLADGLEHLLWQRILGSIK